MCGIFGIITSEERVLGPTLIEAGKMLSYRGYDSVGCATINQAGKIDLRKDAGKVDVVAERYNFKEMSGKRGILQLRWATFGAPSQVNSQPHLDSDGDLVGAHNGNVVNNVELRKEFIAEGMIVRSENDGESCIHAVERYVDKGFEMIEAIQKAYEDLEGDYAFVIGKQDEDVLYAIKKGSGLVAGYAEGATVVSSDLPSLLPLTRRIVRVEDGEIIVLTPDKIELRSVVDGSVIEREVEEITETMDAAKKGSYSHFMLKEMHEQPVVAEELLHLLDNSEEVDQIVARMKEADNIYLVGCGTSYHACLLGSVYFGRLAGKATIPVVATQFIAQYGPTLGPDDVGMFVSQSGETKDVLNAIEVAEEHQTGVLGLVNVIGSTLMRVSEHHIPLGCGYEISVPATKTFTNQVLAFLYLAQRMGGHDTDILYDVPDLMRQTIEATDEQAAYLASTLVDVPDLYQLGYGLTYPMALEGSLKLKEITYQHCEGILSTEFKHGPLSAVEEGYPVIFVAGQQDVDLIVSGINESTCRGGRAIVVGSEDDRLRANGDDFLIIPKVGSPEIEALLAVIPLQLLSYHLALGRGFDPDFPRNLSKTLTVD
jgi:glucosamine--fructose-6-phosphate aminotransferase (isomerizing)